MKKHLVAIICITIVVIALILPYVDGLTTSFVHVDKTQVSRDRYLVVAGHGAKYLNVYQTPGKQSPEWADGLKIYEGYSCKLLAYDLVYKLLKADFDAVLLNPDSFDMTLVERANRINQLFKLDSRVVVISLHHNAQAVDCKKADYKDNYGQCGYTSTATGGATGIEIYTSPGQTRSDTYATYVFNAMKESMPQFTYRTDLSDGDPDKEANFTILSATHSPAILIEWLFMTTYYPDCVAIADDSIRDIYTTSIVNGLKKHQNEPKN